MYPHFVLFCNLYTISLGICSIHIGLGRDMSRQKFKRWSFFSQWYEPSPMNVCLMPLSKAQCFPPNTCYGYSKYLCRTSSGAAVSIAVLPLANLSFPQVFPLKMKSCVSRFFLSIFCMFSCVRGNFGSFAASVDSAVGSRWLAVPDQPSAQLSCALPSWSLRNLVLPSWILWVCKI